MKIVGIALLVPGCLWLVVDTSPSRLSTATHSGACPAHHIIHKERSRVAGLLEHHTRPCSCGGQGWTRVAYLNMSDLNQQCPTNWNLTTSPARGCGRSSSGILTCDSVMYPVNGSNYSTVCGRVNAVQKEQVLHFITRIPTQTPAMYQDCP